MLPSYISDSLHRFRVSSRGVYRFVAVNTLSKYTSNTEDTKAAVENMDYL